MKIKAKITISRPSYGDFREAISITIQDEASRIEFFDGEIPLAEFMKALTGLSHRPIDIEVRGLDVVGFQRVVESRICEIDPKLRYGRHTEAEDWLVANRQEEGWIVEPYLRSQNSFFTEGGKTFVRYHVHKFVKSEEPPP